VTVSGERPAKPEEGSRARPRFFGAAAAALPGQNRGLKMVRHTGGGPVPHQARLWHHGERGRVSTEIQWDRWLVVVAGDRVETFELSQRRETDWACSGVFIVIASELLCPGVCRGEEGCVFHISG